jgi:triacylglycerol lipase
VKDFAPYPDLWRRSGAPEAPRGPGGATYTDGRPAGFGSFGGVADPADAPQGAPDRSDGAHVADARRGPGGATYTGRITGFGTVGCIAMLAAALAAPAALAASNPNSAPLPGETVVMLHGLGLGNWAMSRLARDLRAGGYRVVNRSYPSRSVPFEELAADWLPRLLAESGADRACRLHFVTHSMGGIVVRAYLARERPANLGRIVMLAPPHHGSAVVDHIRDWWLFRLFTGVNGRRLGTDPASFPLGLPPWDPAIELGIIAGSRSLNPVFSAWIGGESDGKVSVASSRLPGMRDHLVLPHSHTWLQYRRDTCEAVARFLRAGRF